MPDPTIDPAANPNSSADTRITPDPVANPNPDSGSWWSSIDFGDAKDSAATALGALKTPQDLLKALEPKPDAGDWRKAMAGSDDKALKTFERFATPADAGKAYLEAVNKIRSGELLKPLPKDATPEQISEYRRALEIPEKPEGYFEKLPNGLVIGEDDKPLFDGFAKAMHELNAPPAMMYKAVEWYYGMQDQQIQAQQVADTESKTKLEGALRTAWGNDFTSNASIYQSFVASAPETVRDALTQARDAEGNFVLYKPEVVSWLVQQAREINPAGHIVPAGGDASVQSISKERDSILEVMRTDRQRYNRDAAMQARLTQLNGAIAKLQERGRAA